jgi:hypothetical protein
VQDKLNIHYYQGSLAEGLQVEAAIPEFQEQILNKYSSSD